MEQDSSYNKRLRKEITARAVMRKKIRMLETDIEKNNEKKMRYLDKSIESKKLSARRDRTIKNIENFL